MRIGKRRVPVAVAADPDPSGDQFLEEKRELLPNERAIIALAIATLQSSEARTQASAQLAVATYGGLAHLGTHVCFTIDLPGGVPQIAEYSGDLHLDVESEPDDHLEIDVNIQDGFLDSVDLTTYGGNDGSAWPPLERISAPPAGRHGTE